MRYTPRSSNTRFGGVNGDLPSITHPWGPRNVTQNCLKRSIHTFFHVKYCMYSTPFKKHPLLIEICGHTPCHRCPLIAWFRLAGALDLPSVF